MSAVHAPNSRASLLAGLRTGGVRSGAYPQAPHTAALGGSFNTNPPPRFISNIHEVDEQDELADQFSHTLHFHGAAAQRQVPMTAAADQQFFQYQQMAQAQAQTAEQLQLLQYQRMQLEIMKYQALQRQQAQQQVHQQAQYQSMLARRQNQGPARRATYDTAPATAAPSIQSFAAAAQLRAAARQQHGYDACADEQQVPMTAGIGSKFATRGLNPNASTFTPEDGFNGTHVISGGTQLGVNTSVPKTSSKSDAAVSWRRSPDSPASLQQQPFSSNASPPRFKITPPPEQQQQQLPPRIRSRPAPLKFTQPADDDSASSSDAPITPPSAEIPPRPLTPREEASKRLYEGLGYNRPTPQVVNAPQVVPIMLRVVSQPPIRQPLGPPSGADELGPRNFASRIRSQTVANFTALLDAHGRRELVEAY